MYSNLHLMNIQRGNGTGSVIGIAPPGLRTSGIDALSALGALLAVGGQELLLPLLLVLEDVQAEPQGLSL